jgi:hypothetical protein
MSTPLIIGAAERQALQKLRERASASPVDMRGLGQKIATPDGKAAHMRQMTEQSVVLAFGWTVTFSIETGHPIGTARHMSLSSRPGRIPLPAAAWMVATELGFVGDLDSCSVWPETLRGHGGTAINIVQPISVSDPRWLT